MLWCRAVDRSRGDNDQAASSNPLPVRVPPCLGAANQGRTARSLRAAPLEEFSLRISRAVRAASVGAALATLTFAGLAGAADPNGYNLFGDAEYVSPGNASNRAVEISSDTDTGDFGGIDFVVPAGTTFAELETLSTDYKPAPGDLCAGGSPRFAIGLDSDEDGEVDGYIFSYFGAESGGAPCVPGVWQNTGDQLEVNRLVDATQLGGLFYEPYATALATYGEYTVLEVFIVTDGSWTQPVDGEQTFQIDNTNVDGHTFTYEVAQPTTRNDCKDGGWMDLGRSDGSSFSNQGDCMQYARAGK